jgi:tol-pal system protein YbgF
MASRRPGHPGLSLESRPSSPAHQPPVPCRWGAPEAISGFQLYLAKYPQGPRADSSTYWLGEAQYIQRDYTAAIKSFSRVGTAYPNSRKAPDALLKVGFCQYELKAFRNARATLQKVAATYPGTETARFAEERLAKMDVEGR